MKKIDPNDVKYTGFTASVSTKRKARQSRALDDRRYFFSFKHDPSGKSVVIDTGVVHWSRKETQRQIEKLRTCKAIELLERLP